MKKLAHTPEITAKLQKAIGTDSDVSKHAVFEAVALNTKPVRKDHFLYKGAVHTPAYLREMADSVNGESRPLQIMHNGGVLPVGRAFHAEVKAKSGGHELRTLFFVDPSEQNTIDKIDNGTVDQVSVSTRPKMGKCSECNFDYFGDKANNENIWTATCPDGHQLGKDAHLVLSKMANFNELSLVNMGGAQGARIMSPSESVLNLDGRPENLLTLNLAESDLGNIEPENKTMAFDVEKLTNQLIEQGSDLKLAQRENADLKTKVTDLETKVAAAGKSAELKIELDAEKAKVTALSDALSKVSTKVLVMSGQVDFTPDLSDPAKLVTLVDEKATAMGVILAAAGKLKGAVDDADKDKHPVTLAAAAFKAPPRR